MGSHIIRADPDHFYVEIGKNLKLITGDLVAVDGAFLRANASKNTLIMRKTVKKEQALKTRSSHSTVQAWILQPLKKTASKYWTKN